MRSERNRRTSRAGSSAAETTPSKLPSTASRRLTSGITMTPETRLTVGSPMRNAGPGRSRASLK
jgi:hypothetical protein